MSFQFNVGDVIRCEFDGLGSGTNDSYMVVRITDLVGMPSMTTETFCGEVLDTNYSYYKGFIGKTVDTLNQEGPWKQYIASSSSTSVKKAGAVDCTCPSRDLWAHGCRCSYAKSKKDLV